MLNSQFSKRSLSLIWLSSQLQLKMFEGGFWQAIPNFRGKYMMFGFFRFTTSLKMSQVTFDKLRQTLDKNISLSLI